jgi:hypothetical protein
MYIMQQMVVLCVLVECQLVWPIDSPLKRTTCIICYICTLLPPDDRLLASPKHVEV